MHGADPRGPHPVGLITLDARDPLAPQRVLPIDVWYPAATQHTGADRNPQNWSEHPFAAPHRAVRDLVPRTEACPLLVFSHGNSGLRQQSTFLTTYLASHGYVVAAPDHVGNTFTEMQGLDAEQRRTAHRAARANRPRDLSTTIDRVLAAGNLVPPADSTRIGAFGHSFGGWTALKMPRQDERVRAVCGLAAAAEPFVGRRAFEDGELPLARDTPALLIAGIEDVLVEIEASILSVFDRLGPRRAAVGIEGADHFHFCDAIPLLHAIHEQTPREGLERPVRPYSELLDEAEAQQILCELVRNFFATAFANDHDPCAGFRNGTAWRAAKVRVLTR
jgi:pimeloyl-ACP methyl ester carboxylesterase